MKNFFSSRPLRAHVGADALPTEDSFGNVSLTQVLPPNVPVDTLAWVVYTDPSSGDSLTINVSVGSYNSVTDRYLVKTMRDGISSLPLGTVISLPRSKIGVQPTKDNPLGSNSSQPASVKSLPVPTYLTGAALGGVLGFMMLGPLGLVFVPIGGYLAGKLSSP